jgi:hypothetical protein
MMISHDASGPAMPLAESGESRQPGVPEEMTNPFLEKQGGPLSTQSGRAPTHLTSSRRRNQGRTKAITLA